MNQTPDLLRDSIRSLNSNEFNDIAIIKVNGKSYITDSTMNSFMEQNNITNKHAFIESVKGFYGIDNLSIIDESVEDDNLKFVYETMLLLEELNPKEVMSTAKGMTLLSTCIKQLTTIICGKKYDKASEIKAYINKCDKLIKDIEKEKKVAYLPGKNQQTFKAIYIYNIAKTLFKTFVVPSILMNDNIQWPSAIKMIFGMPAPIKVGITGIKLATRLPSDIEGLYLSFADYHKLLMIYEHKIKEIKKDLTAKLAAIESKEMK